MKAALLSSEEDYRIGDKGWPIKLAQTDFEVFKHKQETDIANVFGHHNIVNFNEKTYHRYKFYLEFWETFDLTYSYQKMEVGYEQTGSFRTATNDFHFRDQSYGLGVYLYNVRLELGMGSNKSYTFLETDTIDYYFFSLEDQYYYGIAEVKIPTRLWVDITFRLTAKQYKKSENETYRLVEANHREWYASVTGGLSWVKAGPYVAYGYESTRFIHKFGGLMNEMANKQHYQKFGVVLHFFPTL